MAKYRDIADDIRQKIKNQEYTFGQKLPYEYVLCMSYHLSLIHISNVMSLWSILSYPRSI